MAWLFSSSSSTSILWLAVVPVEDVGEGAAGRRSRSSTYPRAFCFVGLARRAVAQALVLALLVIEAEPGADTGLRLGDAGIGVEVNFLVFEAAPQPLNEDVVHVAALAVHADL